MKGSRTLVNFSILKSIALGTLEKLLELTLDGKSIKTWNILVRIVRCVKQHNLRLNGNAQFPYNLEKALFPVQERNCTSWRAIQCWIART